MNASRRWLEAMLRRSLDSREVAERLAMLGAPVDAIEPIGARLDAFVVGLVTEVRQHPNADKLRVTTVDDGSGTMYNVVCGAPNVAAGGKYPFARLGTPMPNGMVIERRKLRGEASEGMLCSARELGLGDDHDGLLTLDTDQPPGTPLPRVITGADERLVVDITANRGDLLGHKGIARELAAAMGANFRLESWPGERDVEVPTPVKSTSSARSGKLDVAIEDVQGCSRLLVAQLRGVRVGPSPDWLQRRLATLGVRSISNVVDATNYMMFELNQPMHAYDAATLKGPALRVRAAGTDESLITLDGTLRTLPQGAMIIADTERAVGIAGVMGGRDTEVSDTTTDLVLECACFDPRRVRTARRALGLSSEASQRFERGVDRWSAPDAMSRCIRLIVNLAGGEIEGDILDCQPEVTYPPRVFVRPERVTQVLGVSLPVAEIERALTAIGATVLRKPDDGRVAVDVPGWRSDLTSEIDLIEEIARIWGYHQFPSELRPFRPGLREDDAAWGATSRLRVAAASLGLSDTSTLPLVVAAEPLQVKLANPLSADHAALRSALLPSLVAQVERNWSYHVRDVRLFEIGVAFAPEESRPRETLRIGFVVTGARQPAHWSRAGQSWDRWDARAVFERLLDLAQPDAAIQVAGEQWVAIAPDGGSVGHCGELAADAPPWADPIFGGEITIASRNPAASSFMALDAFPSVSRDLSLVLGAGRTAAAVTDLLLRRGERNGLTAVEVVDEFRGAPLPPDVRSITVRLRFRSPERTLTDEEVDHAVTRLRASLERELDVTVRTA